MEEYRDGTFGSIEPLDQKLSNLLREKTERLQQISTIHAGTQEELEQIKSGGGSTIAQRVERLEQEIHGLHTKIDRLLIELNIGDKSRIVRADSLPSARGGGVG